MQSPLVAASACSTDLQALGTLALTAVCANQTAIDGVVALGGIAVAVANLQVRRELLGQEDLSQRECQLPA